MLHRAVVKGSSPIPHAIILRIIWIILIHVIKLIIHLNKCIKY